MNQRFDENLTIVIRAFGDCPYLEESVKSLLTQSIKARVVIATSTPSEFITSIANKYGLIVYVNVNKQETRDFRFAYNIVETDYAALAHQDDIYNEYYIEKMMRSARKNPENIIVFCDYNELKDNRIVSSNKVLFVKRLILSTFYLFNDCISSKVLKKYLLAFGNPICFPTVMYHKSIIENPNDTLRDDLRFDWNLLLNLSQVEGGFVYCRDRLLLRRIHEESVTSKMIGSNSLREKNTIMFKKFWPSWLVRVIMIFYIIAEKSNNS